MFCKGAIHCSKTRPCFWACEWPTRGSARGGHRWAQSHGSRPWKLFSQDPQGGGSFLQNLMCRPGRAGIAQAACRMRRGGRRIQGCARRKHPPRACRGRPSHCGPLLWKRQVDCPAGGASSQAAFSLARPGTIRSQRVRTLADGSRWVHVKDPDHKALILVREIKAKVKRPGRKWTKVRFWTNLLDKTRFPATKLVSLYARHWEQEVAFGELKEHLHSDILLKSHTIPTAVQEICALFMAQAVVVSARMEGAESQDVPLLQISFEKILITCRHLCWLWAIAGNEIKPDVWARIAKKVIQDLAWQATKPRRKRSCPRKIRQPVRKWPRLMKNTYEKGEIQCRIRKP